MSKAPKCQSCEELRRELDDIQKVFDGLYAADMRGIKLWQEANPGNDMVWPNRGKLVAWLLTELDRAKKAADLSAGLMRKAIRLAQKK